MASKAVVVCFDGFRPDMLSRSLTPNLHRFRQLSTTFERMTAVFPTDTRANVASLVTGMHPDRHGIMGNAWMDPAIDRKSVFSTGDAWAIEKADRRLQGNLFLAPTIGEILAQSGRTYAVVGTASTGTVRLLHHKVRGMPEHLCLHCHDTDACSPPGIAREAVGRFGVPPPVTKPDLAAIRYAVDAFLGWIWPERSPDLTVIWLNEPDTSYHYLGIDSEQTREAIAFSDREFGRVLDWWLAEARESAVQLFTISDHGQIGTGKQVDVAGTLAAAGLSVSGSPADGADLVMIPGYPVRLYARDRDQRLVERAVTVLREQRWCGDLLLNEPIEIPGSRSVGPLRAAHPKGPDLWVTLATETASDTTDLPGRVVVDAASPLSGVHGGLTDVERTCLAMMAGSRFRRDHRVNSSVSMVDLMPTILAALDLEAPGDIDGRLLGQALTGDVPEDRPCVS